MHSFFSLANADLSFNREDTLLDFGTGTGETAAAIAEVLTSSSPSAIDFTISTTITVNFTNTPKTTNIIIHTKGQSWKTGPAWSGAWRRYQPQHGGALQADKI